MDQPNQKQADKVTSTRHEWKRRAMIAGGIIAIVGWVKGAPHLLSLGQSELDFENVDGLAPFRRLAGTGSVTSGVDIFSGIDAPEPVTPQDIRVLEEIRKDPCTAMFGQTQAGTVPVAMFSDFRCPICDVMNSRLAQLQTEAPNSFHIVRHELPLLGGSSKIASRAVLAAELQGAYQEMHTRLARTPAVTDETYVHALAVRMGLDAERLSSDMKSDVIENKLRVTRGLASILGFYGTPGFAVGRTIFLGSLSKSDLRDLIKLEADNPCQAPKS